MFGFFPSIGPWELGLILVIVLLIFGPGKLPEVGKFIGKGMKEFKKAVSSNDEGAELEKPKDIQDVEEEEIENVEDKEKSENGDVKREG